VTKTTDSALTGPSLPISVSKPLCAACVSLTVRSLADEQASRNIAATTATLRKL